MNESVTVAADAPRYDCRMPSRAGGAPGPSAARSTRRRRAHRRPTSRNTTCWRCFRTPSGKIHMGHVRNYTLGDVVANAAAAQGFSVLHPMGWDSFGLPAENAARERGRHPAEWTAENIATMRAELQRMGMSLDWRRELSTCDPAYYGQQQKLFLDFLRAGLVERRETWVNWDPVEHSVLANEQVIDGRGWRSGALVEKKRRWRSGPSGSPNTRRNSLAALDGLDRWPERVRLMQANWIGRSEGAKLRFALTAAEAGIDGVEVYTTRPDTLFGMSFLAIAPEHPLAAVTAARDPAAAAFIAGVSQPRHQRRGLRSGRRKSAATIPGCGWATRLCRGRAIPCGSPISC